MSIWDLLWKKGFNFNWKVVIKSFSTFPKLQETESQLFFFQNQPQTTPIQWGETPFQPSQLPKFLGGKSFSSEKFQTLQYMDGWDVFMVSLDPLGRSGSTGFPKQKREFSREKKHVHWCFFLMTEMMTVEDAWQRGQTICVGALICFNCSSLLVENYPFIQIHLPKMLQLSWDQSFRNRYHDSLKWVRHLYNQHQPLCSSEMLYIIHMCFFAEKFPRKIPEDKMLSASWHSFFCWPGHFSARHHWGDQVCWVYRQGGVEPKTLRVGIRSCKFSGKID